MLKRCPNCQHRYDDRERHVCSDPGNEHSACSVPEQDESALLSGLVRLQPRREAGEHEKAAAAILRDVKRL